MNEHGVEASIGKARHRGAGVLREDACSRRKTLLTQASIHDRRPLEANLEANDANVRIRGEPFEDEAAAAGANFKLDWPPLALNEGARVHDFALGQARRFGGVGMVLHERG